MQCGHPGNVHWWLFPYLCAFSYKPMDWQSPMGLPKPIQQPRQFDAVSHCFILHVYFGHPFFNGILIRKAALSFVHMDLLIC